MSDLGIEQLSIALGLEAQERRSRWYRLMAFVIALLLVVAGALGAVAAGAPPVLLASVSAPLPAGGTSPGYIVAGWHGDTVHVDWTDTPFVTAETSFIGDRVMVPGDEVQRQLNILNAGPSGAVLSISVRFAEEIDGATVNVDLAEDVIVFWNVAGIAGQATARSLYAPPNPTVIAALSIAAGAAAPVTVGARLPQDVTTHYSAGELSALLRFEVFARLDGTGGAPAPGPVVPPPPIEPPPVVEEPVPPQVEAAPPTVSVPAPPAGRAACGRRTGTRCSRASRGDAGGRRRLRGQRVRRWQ